MAAQVAACSRPTMLQCSPSGRTTQRTPAAFHAAAPARRMASVSSISGAASLAAAAPARAATRCRAAAAVSVRSEISCEWLEAAVKHPCLRATDYR